MSPIENMPLTEDDKLIIENIITKVFDSRVPAIISECKQKDELLKAQCEAHRIFEKEENVKSFYNTNDVIENHIEVHKKKESNFRWVVGIIISIFTGRAIWDVLQWLNKHNN